MQDYRDWMEDSGVVEINKPTTTKLDANEMYKRGIGCLASAAAMDNVEINSVEEWKAYTDTVFTSERLEGVSDKIRKKRLSMEVEGMVRATDIDLKTEKRYQE